jgi:hypothetical protein
MVDGVRGRIVDEGYLNGLDRNIAGDMDERSMGGLSSKVGGEFYLCC